MTGPEDTLARLREAIEVIRGISVRAGYWVEINEATRDLIVRDTRLLLEYAEANEALLHRELRGDVQMTEAQDRYDAARRALGLEET